MEERILALLKQEREARECACNGLQKEVDALVSWSHDVISVVQFSLETLQASFKTIERQSGLRAHDAFSDSRNDLDALTKMCDVFDGFFSRLQLTRSHLSCLSKKPYLKSFDEGQIATLDTMNPDSERNASRYSSTSTTSTTAESMDVPMKIWIDECMDDQQQTYAHRRIAAVDQESATSADDDNMMRSKASPTGFSHEDVSGTNMSSSTINNTLMVRNLPCSATTEDVRNFVKAYGFEHGLIFCHLPQRKNKKGNLGYGFLCLESTEMATQLTQMIQGRPFPGSQSPKKMEVSAARIQGLHENMQHFEMLSKSPTLSF